MHQVHAPGLFYSVDAKIRTLLIFIIAGSLYLMFSGKRREAYVRHCYNGLFLALKNDKILEYDVPQEKNGSLKNKLNLD